MSEQVTASNKASPPVPDRLRQHSVLAPLFPLARGILPFPVRNALWTSARVARRVRRSIRRKSRRLALQGLGDDPLATLAALREITSRTRARRIADDHGLRAGTAHPRIICVCLQYGVSDLVTLAQELDQLKRLQPAMSLTLLVDVNAFNELRRFPIAVEHVTPRAEWDRHRAPATWLQHLRDRLSELREEFATDKVVHLPISASPEQRHRLITQALLTDSPANRKIPIAPNR